jgi:hypothetical protein
MNRGNRGKSVCCLFSALFWLFWTIENHNNFAPPHPLESRWLIVGLFIGVAGPLFFYFWNFQSLLSLFFPRFGAAYCSHYFRCLFWTTGSFYLLILIVSLIGWLLWYVFSVAVWSGLLPRPVWRVVEEERFDCWSLSLCLCVCGSMVWMVWCLGGLVLAIWSKESVMELITSTHRGQPFQFPADEPFEVITALKGMWPGSNSNLFKVVYSRESDFPSNLANSQLGWRHHDLWSVSQAGDASGYPTLTDVHGKAPIDSTV